MLARFRAEEGRFRPKNMPGWFHPGLTREVWCGRGDLNPHDLLGSADFHTTSAFAATLREFVVWTIPSPSFPTEDNDALALLLAAMGLGTSNEGIALRMSSVDEVRLRGLLEHIVREKWGWALPDLLSSRPSLRQP